jgi:hypothetical protein
MRWSLAALTFSLAALGCGPEYAVRPTGGLPQAEATGAGLTMTAFAEQWESSPYDLADYVTPVAVALYNVGPEEVRVSLMDFQLRDQDGVRYAAINPFLPAASIGARPAGLPARAHAAAAAPSPGPPSEGVEVAARGVSVGPPSGARGAPGGGYRFSPRPSGGVTIGPQLGRRWSPSVSAPGAWHGFLVSGGLRGYYGPGAIYYGGVFAYPPYYSDWVYPWGYQYPLRPSTDVLALALPEGVLPAGAQVNGFIYFKNATQRGARRLDLAWEMHDASGRALGSLHVPLDVVKR